MTQTHVSGHCKRNLKHLLFILTTIALFGCGEVQKDLSKNDLKGLNDFLGEQKTGALNTLIQSFDNFLQLNYPQFEKGNARIQQYLLDHDKANLYYPDSLPKWKFDHKDISSTLEQLEISGMRKEICIYGYEKPGNTYSLDGFFADPFADIDTNDLGSLIIEDLEEEIIPIWYGDMDSTEWQRRIEESERRLDSLLFTNIRGQLLYGLAKFSPNDTTIQRFLEVTNMLGGLPEITMAETRLGQEMNFEEPFFKRLIVADTYYFIINAENKKKQRHTTPAIK